jgi:hypothetical protein
MKTAIATCSTCRRDFETSVVITKNKGKDSCSEKCYLEAK